MGLDSWQWIIGGAAAVLVGVSKTGIPGTGILVVPLLASVFGGRPSVGLMLPMLLIGDVFAVAWYRRHAEWDKLIRLFPWVVAGIALGAVAMWRLGDVHASKDIMNQVIGFLVLAMLAIHLLSGRLGQLLTPKSGVGMAGSGITAGFATTVSNAAGPVMQIYMAAHKMSKEQFMGTTARFFFIVNASKVPIFAGLSIANPKNPVITLRALVFDAITAPLVIAGVFIGIWLLPRIPLKVFNGIVLVLAGIYAIKLIAG